MCYYLIIYYLILNNNPKNRSLNNNTFMGSIPPEIGNLIYLKSL